MHRPRTTEWSSVEEVDKDNSELLDAGAATQQLSMDDIAALRAAGKTGNADNISLPCKCCHIRHVLAVDCFILYISIINTNAQQEFSMTPYVANEYMYRDNKQRKALAI